MPTRVSRTSFIGRLVLIIQFLLAPVMWSGAAVVGAQETWTVLPTIDTSEDTTTTVQSKAWFHGHTWWAVLPSSTPSSGTWLFRLESNNTWTPVLKVSTMKGKADAKADAKSDAKADTKPAAGSETKSEAKSEVKVKAEPAATSSD